MNTIKKICFRNIFTINFHRKLFFSTFRCERCRKRVMKSKADKRCLPSCCGSWQEHVLKVKTQIKVCNDFRTWLFAGGAGVIGENSQLKRNNFSRMCRRWTFYETRHYLFFNYSPRSANMLCRARVRRERRSSKQMNGKAYHKGSSRFD